MATAVYILCALTSTACALLLARSYLHTRTRLLLWSALCFMFLALNNLLLVVDLALWTSHDLRVTRTATALAGVTVLLYGFIFDTDGADR
jgi:hypothetical protein